MQCPGCGHENTVAMKFCGECGTALALVCGHCGSRNAAGHKFCGECGARLTTIVVPPPPAPHEYTPKDLAQRILTSKATLEGERKQVTVLFADLKGSMELLAERDPEEARKILDPVLELMMEAVHRYEGTVNQVMGDGIMALFGAPLAHEDHAVRACYAALRMQERVRHHADGVRRSHGVEIQVRVGLNSGDVVVRSIGNDLRMDYTAVGQTTHLAARMEQLATPGTIRLTIDTLRLAEGYIDVKPLGPVPVKGLAQPIEVYEATGAGAIRTRLQASVQRGLTRFVGRDPEMDQLRRAHELADKGSGQVAAIIGEAGVGKSRLVYEFTHSHRLHGWLVLEGASVSYGKATSYMPVIDLLKGYFKIADHADRREIREKVTGKVLTLDRALEPTLPALLALLDPAFDDTAWTALDPVERRQRTLDAVRRLLLREAREQSVVLMFEDLHWIDSDTQALLDTLVETLASVRVLLLVNYRPEYQHGWSSKTYYTQMRVDALAPESAGELLDALLGDEPALGPLKHLLGKRGNPFFLEETVRTLFETGALAGARGRYRLVRAVQEIQVPPTVQAILAARIDRLAVEDKRLLQVASVVGKDVPFALLQAVAEVSDEALRRGLERLQAAEFLYETKLFPDLEYAFKHALTHDVAYGGLLHERRRALHARLVETIERFYPDRSAGDIERLAHHAVRGELWEKALAYLRQACTNAMARSANRDAVGYSQQAIAALAHMPETPETLEHAVDLHRDLRNALYAIGELEAQLQAARERERLATKLGDQRRIALSTAAVSGALLTAGHPAAEAIPAAEAALPIADACADDLVLYAFAHQEAAQAYFYAGDLHRSERELRAVVAAVAGDPRHGASGSTNPPGLYCRCLLVWSLAARGEFAAAATYGHEALDLAERIDHPHAVTTSCWALGYLAHIKGEFSVTIQWWERGAAVAHQYERAVPSVLITGSLCEAYARAGRTEDALARLDESIRAHEALRAGGVVHSIVAVHLGEACLLTGRVDDARALAERGLTLTRGRGQRAFEGWALRLLAQLAASEGPSGFERSEERWREAMAIGVERDLRPLVAHCHVGLAKVYRDTGRTAESETHRVAGTAMYRELGMTYWLEKATAELSAPA